ncbi:hypothetical protein V6N13_025826 [Hibiscus sabdariffa]|uniref:CRM domain-containing protein n=1 Tax=Hibiscus sabdariffa TaxID=183260 RepID=A0ABR2NFD4_9ROSI
MKEFDSFVLPPPNKKGKSIQKPGPYLPGTGPRYFQLRLTSEEVKELVNSCLKSQRQLNMGRDGLTHNMLENIHAHWKRRRVCKIKCKGVCTVDMDNVCEQLERAPEGLTLEQATEMRKKGRNLMPIRKLAKNGVYADLVKNVREAFEECELVRINCQGIKGSDYRKIGAKLKDLVPCVLISFEDEHILIWRGNNWKSSFLKPSLNSGIDKIVANEVSITRQLEGQKLAPAYVQTAGTGSQFISSHGIGQRESVENERDVKPDTMETMETTLDEIDYASDDSSDSEVTTSGTAISDDIKSTDGESESMTYGLEPILDYSGRANVEPSAMPIEIDVRPVSLESSSSHSESSVAGLLNHDKLETVAQVLPDINGLAKTTALCTERVLHLMKQAVESGSAAVLDDATLDADEIYKRSVAFARSAPPGPVFRRQPRKVAIQKNEEKEPKNLQVKEITAVAYKRGNEKQASKSRKFKDIDEHHLDVVPKGSLRVDELAKLLA